MARWGTANASKAGGDFPLHGHLRVMPTSGRARSVLARHADHSGVEMDLCTPGVALAVAQIAELRRQAEQRRLAGRLADRTRGRHRDRAPGSPRRPGCHGQADQATIAGPVTDQQSLHGLLAKVHDPGRPLLEVRRIDPD
jgi:hypothetical protein